MAALSCASLVHPDIGGRIGPDRGFFGNVQCDMVQIDVAALCCDQSFFGRDGYFVEPDIAYGHLGQAGDGDGGLCAFTGDPADMEVAEFGCLVRMRFVRLSNACRCVLIIRVEQHGFFGDILHRDVLDINIVDESASSHIAFKAKADIGAGERAVADEDIVHAAVGVAADDETAVRAQDGAAGYDDVFQGGSVGTGSAGFHADTVIPGIDRATIDHNAFAGADIDAIPVLRPPVVVDPYMVQRQIRTVAGVENELRRIPQQDALYHYPFAFDEGDHHWPAVG